MKYFMTISELLRLEIGSKISVIGLYNNPISPSVYLLSKNKENNMYYAQTDCEFKRNSFSKEKQLTMIINKELVINPRLKISKWN